MKTHFTHFLFSVKPQNIQLLTNASSNQACLGSYLNFTCSVGSANPPVTSYELFKNDVVVDTSSSGMWIRMPPNSGVLIYKCLANNTEGTANSTSIILSVGGKYYIPLIVLFYFVLSVPFIVYVLILAYTLFTKKVVLPLWQRHNTKAKNSRTEIKNYRLKQLFKYFVQILWNVTSGKVLFVLSCDIFQREDCKWLGGPVFCPYSERVFFVWWQWSPWCGSWWCDLRQLKLKHCIFTQIFGTCQEGKTSMSLSIIFCPIYDPVPNLYYTYTVLLRQMTS